MPTSAAGFDGLFFPPEWVKAALVLALISTWVVIGLFTYVYRTARKSYLGLWIVAWMFYSVYLAAAIGLTETPDMAFLVMARRACIGVSALFMFWGSFHLVDRRRSEREVGLGIVLALAWSYVAAYKVREQLWITVPVFVLLAAAGFVTGILYWRRRGHSRGARILGAGFLLWGVHLIAFPFVGLSHGFEAAAYVVSALFAGLISMGMIVETQAALSEDDYRTLFGSAIDAAFLLDPVTLQIFESNAAAHRMTGRDAAELAVLSFDKLSPEIREGLTIPLNEERLVRTVAKLGSEFRIAGANGNLIDCNGRASIAQCPRGTVLHVMVQDISKAKRGQIRLAARHVLTRVLVESPTLEEAWPKILQALCQNLSWHIGLAWKFDSVANVLRRGEVWHEPFVSTDALKAIIEQRTLAPGVELPGRVWNTVLPGWISDACGTDLHPRAKAAASAGWTATFAFPIKFGSERLGVIELFRREHRQPDDDEVELFKAMAASIGAFIQRKRAEEALRESHQQLQRALADLRKTQQQVVQQERLHALGHMASGVAHDFNNAVAKILGFNELLLSSPEHLRDEAKVRQYLQMTNTAAQDAANVVRRLREFYRKREATDVFEPIDVAALMQQAIALAEPKWRLQAQAGGVTIKIETKLTGGLSIAGNAADLREILTNLVFNAVDAMPQGGTIGCRSRRDGEHVVIEISDTGTGMSEEVRRRCFEPFFSTKGDSGTGLGLAIVYGIVKRHGGEIEVRSESKVGTTFVVSLPVYTDNLMPASPGNTEIVESCLKVLLVEDEGVLREIAGQYLTGDGHVVEAVANGSEALNKFRARRYDLIITDWAMPEMNGDQLAAAIKEVSPATPVIMMTGFSDIRGGPEEQGTSADLILGKPFTQAGLRHAVAKATAAT